MLSEFRQQNTFPTFVTLLGSCSVVIDNVVAEGVPSSYYRLAAYLILSNHHLSEPRTRISGMLWPDVDHAKASANLRQLLARIRATQHEHAIAFIVANFQTVSIIHNSNVGCDLIEFVALIKSPDPRAAVRLCELYSGDLLADLGDSGPEFEDWLLMHRSHLRNQFIDAVSAAIAPGTTLLAADRRACAEHLAMIDPCNEDACRALMIEAGAAHKFSRVQALYETCSRHLRDDLGIRPSAETTALFQALSRSLNS